MENFRPWRGGYLARADENERRFLAGLASDVALMLGHPIDDMLDRSGSSDDLSAYEAEFPEFDEDDAADGPEVANEQPIDDAFFRLLPDMSEDPDEAASLRRMTEGSLARIKAEHLAVLWSSLNGPTDDVWVGNEELPAWLAGSNSVRLVVAARLGIVDEATADRHFAKAMEITGADGRGHEREIDDSDDLLSVLYMLISWWQDSLLTAVRNKRLRG